MQPLPHVLVLAHAGLLNLVAVEVAGSAEQVYCRHEVADLVLKEEAVDLASGYERVGTLVPMPRNLAYDRDHLSRFF